jgi:phosphoserine phosphatase
VKQLSPSAEQSHQHHYLTQLFNNNKAILRHPGNRWVQQAAPELSAKTPTLTLVAPALTLHLVEVIIAALEGIADVQGVQAHPLNSRLHQFALVAQVTTGDEKTLKDKLTLLSAQYHCDLAYQGQRPTLLQPGLLVMDMDSTLIQIECIDEIAKLAGVGDKVAAVTQQAMRGELAFSDSLTSRVACLAGVEEKNLAQIRDSLPFMPGVQTLVEVLKQYNWKLVVASGGFTYFADYVQQRLGLDAARANVLAIDNGKLTGEVVGGIVDGKVKADTVTSLRQKWHIADTQTVAMGDGANDLPMMSVAALGVACHAKPVVNENADVAIRFSGLDTLLQYLHL